MVRGIAALIDVALLDLAYIALSALFGVTISDVLGDDGLSAQGAAVAGGLWLIAGSTYLGMLWSFAGQTVGMRLLSIRLDADVPRAIAAGGRFGIGARRATRRVIGTWLGVLTLGVGFLIALFDDRRRTLADRMAGTTVIEDDRPEVAPWSQPHRGEPAAGQ